MNLKVLLASEPISLNLMLELELFFRAKLSYLVHITNLVPQLSSLAIYQIFLSQISFCQRLGNSSCYTVPSIYLEDFSFTPSLTLVEKDTRQ